MWKGQKEPENWSENQKPKNKRENQLKITTFFKTISKKKGVKQPNEPKLVEKSQKLITDYIKKKIIFEDYDFGEEPGPNLDPFLWREYFSISKE